MTSERDDGGLRIGDYRMRILGSGKKYFRIGQIKCLRFRYRVGRPSEKVVLTFNN